MQFENKFIVLSKNMNQLMSLTSLQHNCPCHLKLSEVFLLKESISHLYMVSINLQEVEKKKPSGIPLICGSLNWDLMGREKSRVNASK